MKIKIISRFIEAKSGGKKWYGGYIALKNFPNDSFGIAKFFIKSNGNESKLYHCEAEHYVYTKH